MTVAFQPTLFGETRIGPGPLDDLARTTLGRGAWIDVLPGWFAGADELFGRLVAEVPWRAERREMYDRVVDVPRLVHTYGIGEVLPDPALAEARAQLSAHYRAELGEDFVTAGCCYYRNGRDSVAWHGDTVGFSRGGRGRRQDTMVAIVSFGDPRKLLLRPRGPSLRQAQDTATGSGQRGESHAFALGHGDLVVMGGSCQRTWEHAVPKTARPVGPRISVQFRPRNVF